MLRSLTIRDFVIVDRLELEFSGGFGVLTGETGAGKSILLDALGLVLGGRGEAGMVRSGRDRADVAPDLSPETFWYYKSAHLIDQTWSIRAAGVRQRHIDQSQSMNFYITNEFTFRKVLGLYILAFEQGVKTVYYVRSKSLEVEDCTACSS